jgi:uncharacterized protein YegP (UPF0339 family)
MRKLIVCVALLAGMAASTMLVSSASLAQGTKKDKKDKVAKDKGAPLIEITEGKDGKFRFFVRNGEGKLLAMSSPTGFASEKDASKAIDELKEAVKSAKVTHGKSKKDKDSK